MKDKLNNNDDILVEKDLFKSLTAEYDSNKDLYILISKVINKTSFSQVNVTWFFKNLDSQL